MVIFLARNCWMLGVLWASALSLCSSHNLSCHNSSCTLCEANTAGSFADWSFGPVAMPLISKNVINMTLTVLLYLASVMSVISGFWVVLKNPCLITMVTLQSKSASIWKLAHLHAVLLLIIIQQPWHNFCKLSTSPNIWYNLQTLPFFMSSWLKIIWTVNQQSPYTTCSPESCLLKASHSLDHLPPPHIYLWTSCVAEKHMCVRCYYLHTLTKVLVTEFSQPNQNFQIYLLLGDQRACEKMQ